jgi:hypothetical protein
MSPDFGRPRAKFAFVPDRRYIVLHVEHCVLHAYQKDYISALYWIILDEYRMLPNRWRADLSGQLNLFQLAVLQKPKYFKK